MRKPYEVRKAEAKQRARKWWEEHVEKSSHAERRMALLRELTESETNREGRT
jgi:hypothetical protein